MHSYNYISEDDLDEFEDYKIEKRDNPRIRVLAALMVILVVAAGVLLVYTQLEKKDTGQALKEQEEPTQTSEAPQQSMAMETPTTQTSYTTTTQTTTRQQEETQQPQTTVQTTETIQQETRQEKDEEQPTETTTTTQTTTYQTTSPPQPLQTTTQTTPQTQLEESTQTETISEETPSGEETTAQNVPQTPLPKPQVVQLSPYEACENLERTRVDEQVVMCAVNQSFDLVSLARSLEGDSPLETLVNIAKWIRHNIEYDAGEYGLEQYVLTPKELLTSRKGDSEDWSLLEFSLLTAIIQQGKPVFAEIILEGGQVHYATGLHVNGTVFIIEPEETPYPRELLSDYYGMWQASGHAINNVVLYMLGDSMNELLVYNVTEGWNATVPYHPTADELRGAIDAAFNIVLKHGFYVDCPPYTGSVLRHMVEKLPQDTPVVLLPYVNASLPVDWYVTHDYIWVRERVEAFLSSSGVNILDQLSELASKHPKCVAVSGEVDTTVVRQPVYVPNALPRTIEETREAVILYFAVADRIYVNATHTYTERKGLQLVIEGDYRPGIIEIFLVQGGKEAAAIVAPGWAYQGLENLEASKWEFNGTHTIVTVPTEEFQVLGRTPVDFGIDVRLGGVTVYLALLVPES